MILSGGRPLLISGEQLADRTPLAINASYYAPTGLSLTQRWASYAHLYTSQVWPYAIVKKLGNAVARLPFPVYRREDSGRVKLSGQPGENYSAYAELMGRPNPKLDPFTLWLWTSSTKEIYGEAMWLKLRDERRRVRELYPIHPANLVPRRLDGEDVYLYTSGPGDPEGVAVFPADDIVHFKDYNPDTLMRGVSPLEPLRQTLLSEDATRRGAAALWRNGARPSVALAHPNEISDDAMRRLKAQWDSIHSGVDNWAKTVILEEGMVPHVLQLSAQEMAYLDIRKLNREEACAVWDMPPPAVHILDRATFSNITEQFRSVYRDTMAPRLGMYEAVLQHHLAPDFAWEGPVYGEFLLDEVLRGDFEQRAAATAQAIQTGQLMPSEARALDNRPFIEGSDRLMVNGALIPLDVMDAVAPATGTNVEVLPQRIRSVKAISGGTARRVDGRLASITDIGQVSVAQLLAGVTDTDDRSQVADLVAAGQARNIGVGLLRRWIAASSDLMDLTLEAM